jgi:hypothetical protein
MFYLEMKFRLRGTIAERSLAETAMKENQNEIYTSRPLRAILFALNPNSPPMLGEFAASARYGTLTALVKR